jgi:hypothetical protein
MLNLKQDDKPGVLVMVRVFEVIASFMGAKPEEIMQNHIFDCKRLNSRIKSMRIGILTRKIQDLENKLSDKIPKILHNYLKTELENMAVFCKPEDNEFLIEFFVPFDKQIEINEMNKYDIITHFSSKITKLSNEDFKKYFNDFIFRKENVFKYSNKFKNVSSSQLMMLYYNRSTALPYITKFKEALSKYDVKNKE